MLEYGIHLVSSIFIMLYQQFAVLQITMFIYQSLVFDHDSCE